NCYHHWMSLGATAGATLTLAITGASGAAVAQAALDLLERDPRVAHVDLVASPHGLRVAREELDLADGTLEQLAARLLGRAAAKTQVHDDRDIGATSPAAAIRARA